jgi:endo-1,4-beta-xylanase
MTNISKVSGILVFIGCVIATNSLQADPIQTNVLPLKTVYANDFKIGCLLSYRHVGFTSDTAVQGQSAVIEPNGGDLIKFHMNSMSPGNNMKMMYTFDSISSQNAYSAASGSVRDSIEINPVVRFNGDIIAQLNWAKRQGFTFRGHTLVWHSSAPKAFFYSGYKSTNTRLSKDLLTKRMENYIKSVFKIIHKNWPGLLSAMDVVNEAIGDNSTIRTTNNEWYTTFKDDSYVMKAFEFSRKYTTEFGETQIKLYYNDYNTDFASKADAIVKLVSPIYAAGLLDGIGMQEHSNLTFPSAAQFIATYNKFSPVCNEMAITELDISTASGTNYPSAALLQTQANQYANLFKCFVERSYYSGRGKIISVSKDGLNDSMTFVTNQASSLWDVKNQCKPAFYAVINVGLVYNRLDTLIKYTEKLNQANYSSQEWTDIQSALTYAKSSLAKNYSGSESAVDRIALAISYLLTPSSLTNGIRLINNTSITRTQNQIILNGLTVGSNISVYDLNGALLKTYKTSASNFHIQYSKPCIIKVFSGNNLSVYKAF